MSVNFVSFNTDAVYSGLNLSARQMPINPLGNKEVERAITENSEAEKKVDRVLNFGEQVVESQKTDVDREPDGSNVPWADIMEQLQLQMTGNEEEDFNNIMEEIQFQIDNAQSQYDLNYYEWLMEHTSRLFMSLDEAQNVYERENENRYLYTIDDFSTVNMQIL